VNDRGRAERRHRWIVWDTSASLAEIAEGRSGRTAGATAGETRVEPELRNGRVEHRRRKSGERSRVSTGRDAHLGGPSRATPLAEARGATSRIFARVFESARARVRERVVARVETSRATRRALDRIPSAS
jgi:hypothetical protein